MTITASSVWSLNPAVALALTVDEPSPKIGRKDRRTVLLALIFKALVAPSATMLATAVGSFTLTYAVALVCAAVRPVAWPSNSRTPASAAESTARLSSSLRRVKAPDVYSETGAANDQERREDDEDKHRATLAGLTHSRQVRLRKACGSAA